MHLTGFASEVFGTLMMDPLTAAEIAHELDAAVEDVERTLRALEEDGAVESWYCPETRFRRSSRIGHCSWGGGSADFDLGPLGPAPAPAERCTWWRPVEEQCRGRRTRGAYCDRHVHRASNPTSCVKHRRPSPLDTLVLRLDGLGGRIAREIMGREVGTVAMLAEVLGVAPAVLRPALRALEADRVLEERAGPRGAFWLRNQAVHSWRRTPEGARVLLRPPPPTCRKGQRRCRRNTAREGQCPSPANAGRLCAAHARKTQEDRERKQYVRLRVKELDGRDVREDWKSFYEARARRRAEGG